MESKDIKDVQLYAKAYDAGYKVKLYNPELFERIESVFKGKPDEYSQAFIEGSREAEKELEKKKEQQRVDKSKDDLKNLRDRNQSKDKGKDIER